MSLKSTPGKCKVGLLTAIREQKKLEQAQSWWLARAAHRAAARPSSSIFVIQEPQKPQKRWCPQGTSACRVSRCAITQTSQRSWDPTSADGWSSPLSTLTSSPPGCHRHRRPTPHCRLLDWERAIQRSGRRRVETECVCTCRCHSERCTLIFGRRWVGCSFSWSGGCSCRDSRVQLQP